MNVASEYIKAQDAATAQFQAPQSDPLDGLLPSAYTDPILAKLRGLPRQGSSTPYSSKSSSDGRTVTRLSSDGLVEGLTWTTHRVIWTLGNSIERIFDFDEPASGSVHAVRQALWADFHFEGINKDHNATGSPASANLPHPRRDQARKLFGPFAKPLADAWSDHTSQSSAFGHSSTPQQQQQQRDRIVNGICIFLTEAMHIIFPHTGQHLVFHMPFLLKQAWPLPTTGLLLERQLEVNEETHQPFGLDAPLPTLYTLQDLYDELRFVSLEQQPFSASTPAIPRSQPFTDAKSDILLLSKKFHLAVSFSQATCRLQLARLTHPDPPSLYPPQLGDSPARPSRFPAEQLDPSSPSTAIHPASQAGPSAAAATDRTFVGEGHAAETALMPEGPQVTQNSNPELQHHHQGAAQCDLCLQVVWESQQNLDLQSQDQLKAIMFDEQDEVAHLAVLAPRLSQVYLFRLLFDGGKLSEVHELRTELAADIHLCICTRPQLNDLLLIGLDGHCHVLSASAAKFDLSLKVSDPQSTRVTNYVLQPSPRTPQTHDLRKWGHRDPLVEQSWRALSRVLSAEEFQQLFQAFLLSKTNHSTGDWTALEELLLEPPDVQELDLWQEFVLTQTQQRVQDRKKTSFHPRMKAAAPRVLQALHLLFQDCLCFHSRWQDAHRLGRLLVELSADLDWSTWQEYYRRSGYNCGRVVSSKDKQPEVPDIFTALAHTLQGHPPSWPVLTDLAQSEGITASTMFGIGDKTPPVPQILDIYSMFSPDLVPGTVAERAAAITQALYDAGYTQTSLDDFAFFIALPLREALRSTVARPPQDWTPALYEFLGRSDLAKQAGGQVKPQRLPAHPDPAPSITQCSVPREEVHATKARKADSRDSPRVGKTDSTGLPLFHDRRLEEVGRILRWWTPLVLRMPGVSADSGEMPPAEKQLDFVKAVAARTQSLPAGAALFTFRRRPPLRSNESAAMPDITLSVKLLPMGVQIALDLAALPGERRRWPKFHTGVAMALQQDYDGSNTFMTNTRAFGKPHRHDLDSRNAGYLLGLGLTGQIRSIAVFQVFEYLDPKHELTSIGVLLGMSAAFVGTADRTVSSMLAVHLSAFHPSGSADLNISLLTQSAAMLGHGLLYMNTRQRPMADKILRELSRTMLRNREQAESCREAYALSSGFAFGMIMLAQGREGNGSEDEALLRKFKSLLDDDGQSSLLDSAGNENNGVDVSITSPAATVALAMMFLDSDRSDVLELLALPEDEARLDYIRPDLILLRTIARCLVRLSSVKPTTEWIHSLLPTFIARAYRQTRTVNGTTGIFSSADLELAYWNIITGACYVIGLRYAGTASLDAHRTLSYYLDQLGRPLGARQSSLRGKLRQNSLQRSMNTIQIALAMVFAGTGELHILQRLRMLHGKIGDNYDYGTHLSVHMSLGLLFLGGGRHTVSSKAPGQLASLFLAFYPIWPRTSSDNQMHLQAYRHLWALAVEPRCLRVRDVDTDQHVHMPIKLHVTELSTASSSPDIVASKALSAPTLLPELSSIRDIRIDSVRYWPVHLDLTSQTSQLENLVDTQTLYVKRHAGRLDYTVDPRGIKGINSRSRLDTDTITSELGQTSLADERATLGLEGIVSSFSSDPHAVATLKYLAAPLTDPQISPSSRLFEAFSTSVLMETLSADKINIAPIHHHMFLASLWQQQEKNDSQATLVLRSLVFTLGFYTSLTWSNIFTPPEELESQSRMPLIDRSFVERIRLRLESQISEILDQEEHRRALVLYIKGKQITQDQIMTRLLVLLRCPPQKQLEELRSSITSTLSEMDKSADAVGVVITAVQQALQTILPFSAQRDHWRLAKLLVES